MLLKVRFFGVVLILLSFTLKQNPQESPSINSPFVVVELFTSQGCSSCPPADRILTKLANSSDQNILPLSYHVDYWNYLGWNDPYSQKKFSLRQRQYARQLQNGTYTPQMVFNGKEECIGSRNNEVKYNITQALKEKPLLSISAKSSLNPANNTLDVTYQLSQPYDYIWVQVALVESEITTHVKRGENRGRRLTHNNVVRSFTTTFPEGQKGNVKLNIPDQMSLENSSVILFVQNSKNMAIIGATKVNLR